MHKIGADLSRRLEAQEKKKKSDCSMVFLFFPYFCLHIWIDWYGLWVGFENQLWLCHHTRVRRVTWFHLLASAPSVSPLVRFSQWGLVLSVKFGHCSFLGRTPNPNSTKDFRNKEIYKKWSRVESDKEF